MAHARIPASVLAKSPNLPNAPKEYDRRWLDNMLQILTAYFRGLDSPNPVLYSILHTEEVTSSTLLGVLDGFTLVDTTGGNVAITLPDADAAFGYLYTVKRISGGVNALTVSATSGNIDGSPTASIVTQYVSLSFRSDGTDYWII